MTGPQQGDMRSQNRRHWKPGFRLAAVQRLHTYVTLQPNNKEEYEALSLFKIAVLDLFCLRRGRY